MCQWGVPRPWYPVVITHSNTFVAGAARQKDPYGAHHEEHVQRHQVRACPYTLQVRLQKVGPVELPLSWSNGDEEVRIRTQHHLPSKPADVVIQILVFFFAVTAHEHDLHKVC